MKISVVVPVYNTENFLEDCIQSLLKQTYFDYEILLVDDGSTDRSGRICDEFAQQEKRVRVIHQKNAGVSAARNAAINIAAGEYVTFVDSDDWVDPDYLSLLAANMRPGGMASCGLAREEYTAKPQQSSQCLQPPEVVFMDRAQAEMSVMDRKGIRCFSCSKMFDKAVIDRNHIAFDPEISISEDHLFVMQYLSCTTEQTAYIRQALYHYRQNPQGAVSGRFQKKKFYDEKLFSNCKALKMVESYIEQTPELIAANRACQVRGKVIALRIMQINGWQDQLLYRAYLRDVRKGLCNYMQNRLIGDSLSRRIGTVLCCISPRLEYAVWKVWREI